MSWPSSSNTAVACVGEKLDAMGRFSLAEREGTCERGQLASENEANCDDERTRDLHAGLLTCAAPERDTRIGNCLCGNAHPQRTAGSGRAQCSYCSGEECERGGLWDVCVAVGIASRSTSVERDGVDWDILGAPAFLSPGP